MTDKAMENEKSDVPTPKEVWDSIEDMLIGVHHMAEAMHRLICRDHMMVPRPDDPEEGFTSISECLNCGYTEYIDNNEHSVARIEVNRDTVSTLLMLAASSGYCNMPIAIVFDKGYISVFAADRKEKGVVPPAD